jgi:hypothetical protein
MLVAVAAPVAAAPIHPGPVRTVYTVHMGSSHIFMHVHGQITTHHLSIFYACIG